MGEGSLPARAASEPRWLPVGEPPAGVVSALEARAQRIRPVLSAVGAVLIGALIGYVVLTLYPGDAGWSLSARLELFLGVVIVAAVAEFALTNRYLAWLDRKLRIQPDRIALPAGRILGVLPSGQTFDFPLKRVQLSKEPITGDWYTVTVPLGRMRPFFLVPSSVAAEIRSAGPFTE